MRFLKQNLVAIVVMLGVVGSFVSSAHQIHVTSRALITAAVKECARNSDLTAIDIAFKYRTAQAARERGEHGLARSAEEFANGKLASLTAPPQIVTLHQRKMLVETHRVGGDRIITTKAARALQLAGCKLTFPQVD